jgi:hypothetical protein
MDNQQAQTTTANPNSYVDDYIPPTTAAPSAPAIPSVPAPSPADEKISQTLEDQNIFHLLGIEDASAEEKEAFLDELQQVIWEDFVENDVDLLLTEEEFTEFKKISTTPGQSEEDRQSAMIVYLEKLVPDLEKIMLEKALELKEEMVRERISELHGMMGSDQAALSKIDQAQKLVDDQQWRDAANLLNSIKS